jgi:hypothetical protein
MIAHAVAVDVDIVFIFRDVPTSGIGPQCEHALLLRLIEGGLGPHVGEAETALQQ